jgi:hypothetical protein
MIVQHFLQCTEQNSFINALPYDPRNLTPNGHTWLTVAVKADFVDKNNYTMVDGWIIAYNSERGLPNDQYIKILYQMSK